VVVRQGYCAFLYLDSGDGNALARDYFSEIKIRYLLGFHSVPIVKTHLFLQVSLKYSNGHQLFVDGLITTLKIVNGPSG
jgi:hypothetical protein